jgi:hypothetical protein
MRIVRPAAGVLLLTLTLGASTVFAATTPVTRQGVAARVVLLDQLRSFLVSVWSPAGCQIDPLGRCLPGTTTTQPHTLTVPMGCRLAPWGRCLPQP